MEDPLESPLIGGRTTQGIIRVGNTVHRPIGKHSAFVHSLLKLLEEKNFHYSPRFLGIDEKGREILTFIEGATPDGQMKFTDEQLIQCVQILKQFHDATEDSLLSRSRKVVCHNDFAKWNMIFNNNIPVGIIDFDEAAPGERIDDLAYFLWTFLDVGSDVSVETQAERIKMLCNAYGLVGERNLVDAILKQQERILEKRKALAKNDISQEARDFSNAKVSEIQNQINWVKKYRKDLQNNF